MSAWTKVIGSYEAIPASYASFFEAQRQANQPLPYLVLTPPLDKAQFKSTEKLIYEANEALWILERTGNRVVAKSYPYQTLQMLEMGNVLLYSWLTLRGLTSEGLTSSTTIEYNPATGDRYLAPFVEKLRAVSAETDEPSWLAEKEKFNYLSALNFKFMNYGRNCLMRGEKVLQTLYQPEIREVAWKLAGLTFYRTVTLCHLTILTDHELILLREDERNPKVRGTRYGGIWQYFPLRSLTAVTLAETSHERVTLAIALSPEKRFEKIFASSQKVALEQLCQKIQEQAKSVQG